MNHIKYHQQLVDTSSCTKIMMEATNGIVQKYIKGVTKDFFLFDSFFF